MNSIEYLRQKLYRVIETGDADKILKISQELDKLIFDYTHSQIKQNKIPA